MADYNFELKDDFKSDMMDSIVKLVEQANKRKEQKIDLAFSAILHRIQSQTETMQFLNDNVSKGQLPKLLRQVVEREVKRAANGQLWCKDYSQRAKSDQKVYVYVDESHWQLANHSQWMDFVDKSAGSCGLSESMLMDPDYMNKFYESMAFNLRFLRSSPMPGNEVWLNLADCTVEIKSDFTIVSREHRKDDCFFYVLDYRWNPDAQCPNWRSFLERMLPDPDARQLAKEIVGNCLLPDHRFEKVFWFLGGGANGKSTFLRVIIALLGTTNVSAVPLSILSKDEKKLALFENKLLNASFESGEDINIDRMKQIASGEPLPLEMKWENPRMVTNYGKVIMACNSMPKAEDTEAYFRRVVILPFNEHIPEEEQDKQLAEKLMKELPGILLWAISGLTDLMKQDGFTRCAASEKAVEDYRMSIDSVRYFLNTMCKKSEQQTEGQKLLEAYRAFFYDEMLPGRPLGRSKFYDKLDALTHSRTMTGNLTRFKLQLR